MKYTISQLRESSTVEVDITRFFPSATEKVIVKVRRLTNEKRNEVVAMMMRGQKFSGGDIEIRDTSWFQQARSSELLHGVVVDKDFPFDFPWDEKTIKELDERNPDLVEALGEAIREMNGPLARVSGGKSET